MCTEAARALLTAFRIQQKSLDTYRSPTERPEARNIYMKAGGPVRQEDLLSALRSSYCRAGIPFHKFAKYQTMEPRTARQAVLISPLSAQRPMRIYSSLMHSDSK
jgi:hypothetical protein